MIQGEYRVGDIQKQLDDCVRAGMFPALDNPSMFLGDVRMHGFRDGLRWAVVIEQLGFLAGVPGHGGINNCLYCFGNCLNRPPGLENDDFLTVTADGTEGPTFDADGLHVRPEARSIRIRGNLVPLNLAGPALAARGIVLETPPQVQGFELLRSLLPEYRHWLLASEAQLRQRVPADLPGLLTVDQWVHPDVNKGVLPSATPMFRMLAKTLVSGDKDFWTMRELPNTHWKHWPAGGRG